MSGVEPKTQGNVADTEHRKKMKQRFYKTLPQKFSYQFTNKSTSQLPKDDTDRNSNIPHTSENKPVHSVKPTQMSSQKISSSSSPNSSISHMIAFR